MCSLTCSLQSTGSCECAHSPTAYSLQGHVNVLTHLQSTGSCECAHSPTAYSLQGHVNVLTHLQPTVYRVM